MRSTPLRTLCAAHARQDQKQLTPSAKRVCLIGFDEPESTELREQLGPPTIAHERLPRIIVRDGELLVEPTHEMAHRKTALPP